MTDEWESASEGEDILFELHFNEEKFQETNAIIETKSAVTTFMRNCINYIHRIALAKGIISAEMDTIPYLDNAQCDLRTDEADHVQTTSEIVETDCQNTQNTSPVKTNSSHSLEKPSLDAIDNSVSIEMSSLGAKAAQQCPPPPALSHQLQMIRIPSVYCSTTISTYLCHKYVPLLTISLF